MNKSFILNVLHLEYSINPNNKLKRYIIKLMQSNSSFTIVQEKEINIELNKNDQKNIYNIVANIVDSLISNENLELDWYNYSLDDWVKLQKEFYIKISKQVILLSSILNIELEYKYGYNYDNLNDLLLNLSLLIRNSFCNINCFTILVENFTNIVYSYIVYNAKRNELDIEEIIM